MEAPHLTRLYKEHKDRGLVVLGINAYNESAETIKAFGKKHKLEHPLLVAGNPVAVKDYHVPDYPANFWIDRKGKVVHYKIGWGPSSVKELEEFIEKLL